MLALSKAMMFVVGINDSNQTLTQKPEARISDSFQGITLTQE